jgi:phytoene/squalene synthetase
MNYPISSSIVTIFLVYPLFIVIIGLFLVVLRNIVDDLRCKKMIKINSLTFYKAFSKIKNRRKRQAIYAVYAFCRYADDIVDEKKDEHALDALEINLQKFVEKKKTKNYFFRALKRASKFYPKDYDYQPFFDMIQGQRMDLNHQGYQTLDDLLSYCYYVASSVGHMLIPILAPKNHHSLKDFANHLGYAMQLTNVLRDVGEDLKRNRIYIPQHMMQKANLKIEDLKSGKINSEFIELFEVLAKLAEDKFDKALNDVHLFPDDAKLPLALSIILYRAILDVCRKNGYDVLTKKNFVTDEKKNALIQNYLKKMRESK